MKRYPLEEVKSGTEESYLWVTLGFSSEHDDNDVVHVVCAKTVDAQDREGGMADVYLERFDQASCCYGGAEVILVTASSVELRLNPRGSEALRFEGGGVSFQVPAGLKGYREALKVFGRMSTLECGKRIRAAMGSQGAGAS